MATRVDLAAAARTVGQNLTAAVDVAYLVRDVAAENQDLSGPAPALARWVAAETAAAPQGARRGGVDVPVVDPADVQARRMIALPASVRAGLVDAGTANVEAASWAMSAGSGLDHSTPVAGRDGHPLSSSGRHAEDRQIQMVLPIPVPGRGR